MTESGTAPVEFAAGVLLLVVPVLVLVLSFAPMLERRVLARSLAADIASTLAIDQEAEAARRGWIARAQAGGVGLAEVAVAVCGRPAVRLDQVDSCESEAEIVVTVIVTVDAIVDSVQHTHRHPVPRFRSRT